MNINTFSRFLLPFVAMSSFSTFAAADHKTYPGAACQPERSSSRYTISQGKMLSEESLSRYWVCPITRDLVNDNTKARGFVWAVDYHSTYNVQCELWSRSAKGGGLGYGYSKKSTSGIGPYKKLSFNSVPIKSWEQGYLYLKCLVPGKSGFNRSGIASYTIIEE